MHKTNVPIAHGVPGVNGALRARGIEHRGLTVDQRVALAAATVTGGLSLHNLTAAQAGGLFRVPPSRISAACRQSPPAPTNHTDKALDRVVARYAADALMRALDRHTSPQLQFAFAAE
jgi:hypothetical protein